jgi:hypothetical protein
MEIRQDLEMQLSAAISTLRASSGVPSDQARYNVAAIAVMCHDAEVISTHDLNTLCQYVSISPKRVKYVVRTGSRAFECIGGGLYLEVNPVSKENLNFKKKYTLEDLESLSTLNENTFSVTPITEEKLC